MPFFAKHILGRVFASLSTILLSLTIIAQPASSVQPLFTTDELLEIRLSGNLRKLMRERDDESTYYPIRLSYTDQGKPVSISLRAKTRGHFRLAKENCGYPPLLLNFSKSNEATASLFNVLDKVKLVTPCRGDKYVVHEYLVYKLYNLLTDKSFRARLVKVIYFDSVKSKSTDPLFGVLLEDDNAMAERNNAVVIERNSVRPEQTSMGDFLTMAVFEYLIGNTDWSIQYLQNIKLIGTDSLAVPTVVPYDFDHAGIVRAPYARPAAELQLHSTLNRRYRGYCIDDMNSYAEVFARFNAKKTVIYEVYTKCPFLDDKYIKETVRFLDEFYATINDPAKAKSAFMYPCDKNGTGNVVIKGLREN